MQRRALLASLAAAAAGAGCQAPASGPLPWPVGGAPAGTAPGEPMAAADPARPLQRIGLGSCIDQNKPQPIWDAVLAAQPGLFLFGGDNVYASPQPWSRAALDAAYATQARVPGFARLRQAAPHLAIWDDHDYGLNDGGAEFAHKQSAKDAFLDFWQVPADDERRGREGLYTARSFGPAGRRLQVIVLDGRWFRSPLKPTDERGAPGKERFLPDPDPAKTMLGDVQWAWLEARLREDADLRLIVSGIQVLAEGHGYERWGNLPTERQRLFDLIGRSGARGVVFLSGDRHVGAVYREAAGTPYPLHELTSSGITHPWSDAREPGPNRLGALVTVPHFGLVDIDWATRSLRLALHGGDGQPLQAHRVALDALRPR
jgi:alkaline phosphatase D